MQFAKLLGLSEPARKKFFEAHGVDTQNAKEKFSERDKRWHENLEDAVFQKHMRFFDSISLWSGDEHLSFRFSDWDTSRQQDSQLARSVGKKCYQLAKEMLTDNFNVALFGNPGVGKTSLALAMLDTLHKGHKTTMFVSTMELALLFDQRIEYRELGTKINAIMEAMKRVDVLLLDDFGTEGGMKKDPRPVRKDLQDALYSVANARLAKDKESGKCIKSTIVTTNNSPRQLLMMYNDKLISRLIPKEQDKIVSFDGLEDVR